MKIDPDLDYWDNNAPMIMPAIGKINDANK